MKPMKLDSLTYEIFGDKEMASQSAPTSNVIENSTKNLTAEEAPKGHMNSSAT